MAYPDAADLVAASDVDALVDLDAAQYEVLYRSSINEIEAFCGQTFVLETSATRVLDGHGGPTLLMPKRLEALDTLVVKNNSLSADDVILSEKGDMLTVPPLAGISNYYERALRDVSGDLPFRFTPGDQTCAVTGDWGWTDAPEDVGLAIQLDMEDQALADANLLSETIRSYRGLGILDVAQGNLRTSVVAVPVLSPRVTRLLLPYVWEGPVGAIV